MQILLPTGAHKSLLTAAPSPLAFMALASVPMFQTTKPCVMWNRSIQTKLMFSRRNLQATANFPRQNFSHVMPLRRNLQATTKFPHQSLTTVSASSAWAHICLQLDFILLECVT